MTLVPLDDGGRARHVSYIVDSADSFIVESLK